MDFWDRVEEELSFQGKTKKELAALTDIKEQTLHKSFERKSAPTAETAFRISKALNISMEFLITGKDTQITSDKNRISPEIKQMITKMNGFSPKQQQVIFDMVDVIDSKK